MNCPKCNLNLAPTISVCWKCGTMMNDSVREELEGKISSKPATGELTGRPPVINRLVQPPMQKTPNSGFSKPPVNRTVIKNQTFHKPETTQISTKLTTPTLVDFQPKAAAIPEWRLEIQNAVRRRKGQNQPPENTELSLHAEPGVVRRTNGATALKAEILELEDSEPVLHENATVNKALQRIEQSRKKFFIEEKPKTVPAETAPKKDFPFYIASKTDGVLPAKSETKTSSHFTSVAKPKLVSSLRQEKPDFDTNKLPPLPQEVKMSTSFAKETVETIEKTEPAIIGKVEEKATAASPEIKSEIVMNEAAEEIIETETEEAEDYAPFAMRFNAGVFDILISSFASLILLAPFILLGGDWFTLAGFFAFLATSAIVMFVYMTTAVGLFGKTFGMKLFSLELIDIEENDYPTFHQAAVSSSVYLLSLALGGTGFLTVPFTSDGRAVHDIVSGTIIVREYE